MEAAALGLMLLASLVLLLTVGLAAVAHVIYGSTLSSTPSISGFGWRRGRILIP